MDIFPKRQKGMKFFNFSALLFNWAWAMRNGLGNVGAFAMMALLFASVSILTTDPWSTVGTIPFAMLSLLIYIIISLCLFVGGNTYAWKTNRFRDIDEFNRFQSVKATLFSKHGLLAIGGYLLFFLSTSLFLHSVATWGPHGKYKPPSSCQEQLSRVKTGLESYLSENNDLKNVDTYADAVCHHILPGYEKAADCKGLVATRVAKVCDNFNLKTVANGSGAITNYEISGNAKNKAKCGIMVTEQKTMPENYNDCKEEIPRPVH